MKRTMLVLLIAGVALVAGSRVQAHHSFAATYFEDQTVSIEGNLVQFLFRNPHSFVHIEAPDKDGQTQRWAVEWGAGGQLNRQGVSRETLHTGDHVIVTGNPGRNPADHRLRMKTISRPSDTASVPWLSCNSTSPCGTLPCASLGSTFHSASQAPTSDQPALKGMTTPLGRPLAPAAVSRSITA